jgi:predicted metal-binding protein
MRALVICNSCRFPDGRKIGDDGRSGGQTLLDAMSEVLRGQQRTDVRVVSQTCLWNCTQSCSVVFRDSDRYSYVTGRHEPSLAQASAILEWFDVHGQTAKGEVPFRQWPQAMKGHFIARMPPEDE